MRTKTLKRGNFKLIELELMNYHKTLKEYNFLRDEIIHGSPQPSEAIGASRGIDISKPTEKKALRLTSMAMIEILHRLEAIEFAINTFKNSKQPKKYDLLKMKYFSTNYTDEQIIEKLFVDRSTFFIWRKEIIQLIADRLGWQI